MTAISIPNDFEPCPIPDGQFADLVGPLYMKRDAAGLCFGFLVEQRHCNVRGNIHGGMLMTLVDQILGLTVVDALGHTSVVTITVNNEFAGPANAGDWLSGRAEIIRRTNSLVFIRGAIHCGDVAIVNSSGIWKYFASRS